MKLLKKSVKKTVSLLISFVMIISLFTIVPLEAGAAGGVSYVYRSWDGEKVVEEVRTCTSYTTIDSNSLTWSSGWYVLKNNVNLSRTRINVTGDVSLILCDGVTLTDNKGINVGPGASLSIYGQSKNTGKLYIHAYYQEVSGVGNDDALIGGTYDAGNISIYGGTIDLLMGYNNDERYHGAGIGGGKNGSPKQIKIYGGFIKCDTGGNDSACIGGGSGAMASSYDGEGIVIYGGELDLRSSYGAAIGNGKNCTGSTGSIGIYGGTITARSSIGAGIGGGENGGNGPVNIYGGYVTAVSAARECGAGIGGGASASQNAPIRILGGTVVASANKGAGIGGGKNSNGGEIEIANANVIASSTGGGAGIGGGIEGSSNNVHIHSNAVVCSFSTTTKSHQAFADLLNMCVGDAKMKGDASTYGQASVCALALLIDWFDTEFSGCAIGGGNEGSGGTITIEDSRVYAYCGKRAAVIGGGMKRGFDSITISGSEVFARNKPFEDDEDVLSNLENETKDRIKKVIDGVDGAAIGTGDEAESGGGTITIKNHSNVTAIAGTDAAGIGTGDESDVTCTINISDSKVEAHGGRYGAGIGGGDGTDSGNITIDNSDITADSATDGAGIGGGESGKSNTITITDSTVTARGGGYAAGIGGGDHADGGTTIISRSTVRAYGGTDAAGIGGGEDGDGGHIEIYDSDVYAKGKGYGAGIGGGEDSSGDYCSIFGDSRVEAVSGGDGNVQSIGHGDCGWYVSYTGGTLSLDSHLIVNAGSSANDTSEYHGSSRYNAIWGNKYALIRPCGHPDTGWRYMNEASPYHVKYCKKCGKALGEYEEHIWDADHVCTVCHASAEMHTTTYIEQNNSGEVQKKITAPSFTEYEAPECTNTPDGYEFVCWCLNNDIYFEPGDLRNLNYFDMTVKAVYMPVVEATYIDENGVEQTVSARRIYDTDYKLYLSEGWYIFDSNINLDSSIRYRGDVKLIIADGKTLSFTRYSVSGQDPNSNAFWAMDEDYKPSKVTIYGQARQTGVLDIGARYPFFYDFAVNGCTVKLKDEDYPDKGVIGVYKTCTVNRGTLTADRIFCDHLIINGGNVDITNSHSYTESLLGWTKRSDSIRLGYYGDHLRIADGQAFKDENGKIYEGSLTTEQIEALEGKTLTPYIAHNYAAPEWVWSNEYTNAEAVFRCRGCDDVQRVRAKVTYSDDGDIRTSEAKCVFLGEDFTATHAGKLRYDITITPSEHGAITVKKAQEKPGETVDLFADPDEGYALQSLTVTDSDGHEVALSGNSFTMPESDVTVTAVFRTTETVEYIDEDGEVRTAQAIALSGGETDLHEGWYCVSGRVDLTDNVSLCGDVRLILCDGAELNSNHRDLGSSENTDNALTVYRAPGSNEGRFNGWCLYGGVVELVGGQIELGFLIEADILVADGGSLSAKRMMVNSAFDLIGGAVDISNESGWAIICYGDINISGGTLNARADDGLTVNCSGNVNVTGGTVNIDGQLNSCRDDTAVTISGGSVNINRILNNGTAVKTEVLIAKDILIIGGKTQIKGELYAYSDITLGWTEPSDSIMVYDFKKADSFKIADDQALTDGTNTYSGSYNLSDIRLQLSAATLTPSYRDWTYLQYRIDHAESGDTVRLISYTQALADDTAIVIPEGKEITLDLNGYTLDRGLSAAAANGSVITNNGTLTITDSSPAKTGTVTGGYNTAAGGAVLNNGTLTVEGSVITGNCAQEGGAIANKSGAELTFNGGTVTGNTTHQWGGAGILNQGTMTMNGGEITDNRVTATGMNGAGIWTNGSLTVTGGSITGNVSQTGNGGGIYYSGGTLELSGSPVITGNTASGADNDLFINGSDMLSVIGELTENAKIGIRKRELNPNAFTSGLDGNGSAANFISNHDGYIVRLNDNGEAVLEYNPFAKHSLTLNGDIGVNFYLGLSADQLEEGVRVDFAWNGKTDSVTFDSNSTAETREGVEGLFKATCNVCAPEMTDTITASITVGSASEPIACKTYSVREYADVIMENKDGKFTDKVIALVKSMLNYGGAAQVQFADEHPNDECGMANVGLEKPAALTPEEIGAINAVIPNKDSINSELNGTGLSYYGYTMLLHAKTTLRFYFVKAQSDTDISGIRLGDNTAKNYNDRYAYVEVKGIPAYELNNAYTLTVNEKDLGSYSALTYVKDVLTDETSEETLINTVTAMYRYHEAAVAYFANNG